jgi:hypothetical protein
MTGPDIFDKVHLGIPWQRQFSYAREIGFMSPMSNLPPTLSVAFMEDDNS